MALAVAVGLAVLAVGTSVESAIIIAVRPSRHALEWLSDVLASLAVSTLSYLWLHLRVARTRVLVLERARIALDEQLRLAAEIQRKLLPTIPAATPGYLWAARVVPAHEVGGDFYDFVRRDDGTVLVILGDVSGKGIPAALLQASLKTLFRVHASTTADAAAIATGMSAALRAETGGLPYATAIVAVFGSAPLQLTYVNAGHPPGLLLRGSRPLWLAAGGPPLGLLPSARYEATSMTLCPEDVGVLFSDGVTEALDGSARSISELLDETVRAGWTPARLCEQLLLAATEAAEAVGTAFRQDDRSALVFRVEAGVDGEPQGWSLRSSSRSSSVPSS